MAVIATVALVLVTVFVVCCGLLAAFIGSLLYMVVLNHRLRARGLEREEELLATPLPSDSKCRPRPNPSFRFATGPRYWLQLRNPGPRAKPRGTAFVS